MPAAFKKESIDKYNAFSCELKCLAAMLNSSRLPREEFFEKLKDKDPTLGVLGISSTSADSRLRVKINKDILRPAGKTEVEPRAFKAATKASDVIKRVCL